jgi:hypothetical protein
LENLVLHQPDDAGLRPRKDTGRSGAGGEAGVGRVPARLLIPWRKRTQCADDEENDRRQARFDQAVVAKLPQRALPHGSVRFPDEPGRQLQPIDRSHRQHDEKKRDLRQ